MMSPKWHSFSCPLGYTAGAALLNPIRWQRMQTAKGMDGHYLMGATTSPVAANVWNVPVVTAAGVGLDECRPQKFDRGPRSGQLP
jgi:hypothetical protein